MARFFAINKTLIAVALSLAVSISGCGSSESSDAPAATTTEAQAAANEPDAGDLTTDTTSSQDSHDSQESAAATPEGSAQPRVGLGVELTWNELVASVADESEMACIDDAIDDHELPKDFFEGSVMDPVTNTGVWPLWHREILGIEVGDNHWPHQVWRCLESDTAAALYISVRLEELTRAEVGFSSADFEVGCIGRLLARTGLALEVSESLGTEFRDSDSDGLPVLEELDETVDPTLFGCSSEAVAIFVDSFLDGFFDGGLGEYEHDCLLTEVADSAVNGALDAAPLFGDDITDDYLDTHFLPVFDAALQTCIARSETG